MQAVLWTWAAVYVVGHFLLWERVERARAPQPDDEHAREFAFEYAPEPITVRRPAPGTLTPLGMRRWRVARRFSVVGFLGWAALVVVWIAADLARN